MFWEDVFSWEVVTIYVSLLTPPHPVRSCSQHHGIISLTEIYSGSVCPGAAHVLQHLQLCEEQIMTMKMSSSSSGSKNPAHELRTENKSIFPALFEGNCHFIFKYSLKKSINDDLKAIATSHIIHKLETRGMSQTRSVSLILIFWNFLTTNDSFSSSPVHCNVSIRVFCANTSSCLPMWRQVYHLYVNSVSWFVLSQLMTFLEVNTILC